MLRLILAAVGVTAAIIAAPTASAKMCDNHGTGSGQIYIAACAVGGGGGGATIDYRDANGKLQHIHEQDVYKHHR
jgi:type 1 fimbria pilin